MAQAVSLPNSQQGLVRKAARDKGERFYQGSPCKRANHDGMRYAGANTCVQCTIEKSIAWQNVNKEKYLGRMRQWVARNPGRRKEIVAQSHQKHAVKRRAYTSARKKQFPELGTAYAAKRRAGESQRTPKWADLAAIKEIYRLAAKVTAETGVRHEVDHYYPIFGRTVSGLHVEGNLQIIPEHLNRVKANKCPP